MNGITFRWARVEYQPDLQKPTPPIPLGVVVVAEVNDKIVGLVLGREPKRDAPTPPELGHVGPLGLVQLRGWVRAIARDTHEAQAERIDPFGLLASRWHTNLYVTDPETMDKQEGVPPLDVATRIFEAYVKEPFRTSVAQSGAQRVWNGNKSEGWVSSEVEYATPV